jgi:hypothetical protein
MRHQKAVILQKPGKLRLSGHAYLRPECSRVSEMEPGKNRDFEVKMAKLEKVRYASKDELKPCKADR